jgi:hypothetical protein
MDDCSGEVIASVIIGKLFKAFGKFAKSKHTKPIFPKLLN